MRASLVDASIDIGALVREAADGAHGAVASFLGIVRARNDGRDVTGIDYTAYDAMAEREMGVIAAEAAARFGTEAVLVEHRIGYLKVGEASVAIVVSHERRTPALEAVQFVIEELKRRVPIWKCEHYADGTRDWVHAGTGETLNR